ncbi:3-keto-5-aminohexanoate cleavage protein [Halomonas stenophila]|uniref:Uncharacterized protein (DUF849 family) n=1 Tax=Halomonas stenophila TaxID=795312 RepID=A0A7W5ESI8_9GAMM|nr:3-keto-5-aminohexanoate cleavage protein [Halomonas stenophila]MBB3229550.1 uncharacterized protein (DUF849 family) [Halomonas stenophila]
MRRYRYASFQHEWERTHLENSRDLVFKNTFADIETAMTLGGKNGTRFECECYDIGHLYSLRHLMDRDIVGGRIFVQSVFGILGGIGPHPEDVMHMRRTANRLFGDDYEWSVLGAGSSQMRIAAQAAAMGGHVRVGLEDSLWLAPGKLAESNASQVAKVREILEGLSFELATPDEAREMLQLKGAEIGEHCIVGAPAKVVRELTDDEVQSALDNSRRYVQKIDTYRSLERVDPAS